MRDCARIIGVHYETFRQCYKEVYLEGRDTIAMNVRKWQIDKAQGGCSKMLMYLGPVYCEDQRGLGSETLSKADVQEGIDALCALSKGNDSEDKNEEENKDSL